MIGGSAQSDLTTTGDGMRIRVGSAINVANLILTGFSGDALDVRDNSSSFFMTGETTLSNAIISGNAFAINGGVESYVQFEDLAPMLNNVRYEGNPDPRPVPGSPALAIDKFKTPPSDGVLDTSSLCLGTFCGENWLAEWTFFGSEEDYITDF